MEQSKQIEKINEQIEQIEARIKDPHLCEGTASTYTRITGYHRPVENFNDGKQQEMIERLEYKIS